MKWGKKGLLYVGGIGWLVGLVDEKVVDLSILDVEREGMRGGDGLL